MAQGAPATHRCEGCFAQPILDGVRGVEGSAAAVLALLRQQQRRCPAGKQPAAAAMARVCCVVAAVQQFALEQWGANKQSLERPPKSRVVGRILLLPCGAGERIQLFAGVRRHSM